MARLCDQLSKNVREPCVNARVKQLAEESAEKTGPAGGESKDALQARKRKARQSAFGRPTCGREGQILVGWLGPCFWGRCTGV